MVDGATVAPEVLLKRPQTVGNGWCVSLEEKCGCFDVVSLPKRFTDFIFRKRVFSVAFFSVLHLGAVLFLTRAHQVFRYVWGSGVDLSRSPVRRRSRPS